MKKAKSSGFQSCGRWYSMMPEEEARENYIDSLKRKLTEIRETSIKNKK